MIYTITMNPCLDRHLEVERLVPDDTNRIISETRYAAGKGIDVSVVIKELGGESTALGFVGGYDGLELEGRLVNRGVQCDFTATSGETRTNIHIYDRSNATRTSISVPGAEIAPAELASFCRRVRHLVPPPTFVALSGSVPRGVTKSIYRQMIPWLKEQGARVVLDADGEALQEGIKSAPFLIKPNIHEASRLLGQDLSELAPAQIADAAQQLLRHGLEVVVISMGARGLLVLDANTRSHVQTTEVKVQSTIGSGDSVVAGLMLGIARGQSLTESATLGAACGAATAMTPGTELCRRADVEELLQGTKITTL